MHVALLLEMAAEGLGERVALGSRDGGVSFAALLHQARGAAAWLARTPAQNVAYVGLNSATFPVALFAAALAGKPFAPLNYRLPDEQLLRIVARTAPSVLVVDDDLAARFATPVAGVQVIARSAFMQLAAADAGTWEPPPPDPEAIAVLLFTSGTTGEPKAAVLRNRHLTSYVITTVEFMGAGEDEAALVSVPPYHIAGIVAILTAVYGGRRLVQLPSFAAEEWVRMARQEQVTHAMTVPTMLARILDVLDPATGGDGAGLTSVRHLSYGGGRMPVPVIERAMGLLPGVDFVNAAK